MWNILFIFGIMVRLQNLGWFILGFICFCYIAYILFPIVVLIAFGFLLKMFNIPY